MRTRFIILITALCYLTFLSLTACNSLSETTGPPADPWTLASGPAASNNKDGAALFAPCASCHLRDGSGRNDGSIPRLAGQLSQVLARKLLYLQNGTVSLPAMKPFALALTADEITLIADYLEQLPELHSAPSAARYGNAQTDYTSFCAGCHGHRGQGNLYLFAPRLCGQHSAYLSKRLQDSIQKNRGDTDLGMAAIAATLTEKQRDDIVHYIAALDCEVEDD